MLETEQGKLEIEKEDIERIEYSEEKDESKLRKKNSALI